LHRINRAIDNPSLGAVPFVQRMEDGQIINIYEVEEMNREIQVTTEKCFDLLMSAPITMSSLRECLGFLSDTEFAMNMLWGEVHIPADVNDATTIAIDEIMRLFQALHKGHAEVSLGADEFQYYWKQETSSREDIIGDINNSLQPLQIGNIFGDSD
jgi:hypothetical protein